MLRVAVLFAGQFRNSYECASKFLTWLRNQSNIAVVDVYIHVWWSPDYVGKRYRLGSTAVVEPDPRSEIVKHLAPVKLVIEPHVIPSLDGLPYAAASGGSPAHRESDFYGMLCQFESVKRCVEMINDADYDCIVRARPDLDVTDPSRSWNLDATALRGPNVYVSDGRFFTGWPLGDWLFAGNPTVMKLFLTNFKDAYVALVKRLGIQPHIHEAVPEIISTMYLRCHPWETRIRLGRAQMLTDPSSPEEPYWWPWVDKERLKVGTH